MGFTNHALDEFVAQELSTFVWTPRSIGTEFPTRSTWLDEFVLRRVFHAHVPDERTPLAFIIVRRALAAIEEWDSMCAAALGSVRKPSVYFEVLRHCEACIAALWQGLDFGRRALGRNLFDQGDGTVFERINAVYNVGRHFNPQTLATGDLHGVWLSKQSVRTREHVVTFDELREAVGLLGRIGSKIAAGPESAAQQAAAPDGGHG